MMMSKRLNIIPRMSRSFSSEWGSGAGKGGGSGGSIRESGGSFGKMESAREEEYFRRKQREQLEGLKDHFHQEIERHEELIKKHQEAIEQSKKRIADLNKDN